MQVALKLIHPNPLQPRDKKVDVTDLVDSMSKIGLVQPISIAKDGDGYVIIDGHRRWTAATKLGWEFIASDDELATDPKLDIGRIMAVDGAHKELTGKERAVGLQFMIDADWSDVDVQCVTGASVEDIAAARVVATAKKKLVAKMPDQATLEELAGLAEFDGNDEAYKDLVHNVGTGQFAQRLQYQRNERDRKTVVLAAEATLKESGVRTIDVEKTYSGGVLRLDGWQLKDKKLTPKNHAECPGHCARVDYQGEIIYWCDKPSLHGVDTGSNTGPKTDEAKALDRRKRALRALWRASQPVRQEFVIGKLKVKPLNTGLLDWAYGWTCQHGVAAFEGHNTDSKAYTSSKDVRIRFVASCVAAAEYGLENWVTGRGAVGDPGYHGMLVTYLKALVKMGYLASDHETALIKGVEYEIPE